MQAYQGTRHWTFALCPPRGPGTRLFHGASSCVHLEVSEGGMEACFPTSQVDLLSTWPTLGLSCPTQRLGLALRVLKPAPWLLGPCAAALCPFFCHSGMETPLPTGRHSARGSPGCSREDGDQHRSQEAPAKQSPLVLFGPFSYVAFTEVGDLEGGQWRTVLSVCFLKKNGSAEEKGLWKKAG